MSIMAVFNDFFYHNRSLPFLLSIIIASVFIVGFGQPSLAVTYTEKPIVKIIDPVSQKTESEFFAFSETFQGGVSVAACDFGGDGRDEIVAGAGPGGGPHIRLFRANGSYMSGFFPYDFAFRHGVNVACGDFDEDGIDEIVTAPKFGGGPHIRIFDGFGKPKFTTGFMAFHPDFRGGVNIAVGDITGDGRDEILAASGPGSSPHIRVFSPRGVFLNIEFRPFHHDKDKGGVSVAVANVDGGKEAEVIAAIFQAGKSWVKVYKNDEEKTVLGMFQTYEDLDSGIRIAGGDFFGNDIERIVTIPNVGGGPHVRMFQGHGVAEKFSSFPFQEDFRGGAHIAAGDIDNDGKDEIIVGPGRRVAEGRTDLNKYIEVNISEQRLYAYENGYLQYTALISSGLRGFDTPLGEFEIMRKIPTMTYRWTYAPGSPLNYSIPNVKYNLEFKKHFYLHHAYWHNAFGSRRSHGCVNMDLKTSEWIYNWADYGTKVWIHE